MSAAFDSFERQLSNELAFLLPEERIKITAALRKLARKLVQEFEGELIAEIWRNYEKHKEMVIFERKILFFSFKIRLRHLFGVIHQLLYRQDMDGTRIDVS